MGEGEGEDVKSIAASNGGGEMSVSRKNVPATVAEKLELVKSEEAALLREFEDTHKIFAQVLASGRCLYHLSNRVPFALLDVLVGCLVQCFQWLSVFFVCVFPLSCGPGGGC